MPPSNVLRTSISRGDRISNSAPMADVNGIDRGISPKRSTLWPSINVFRASNILSCRLMYPRDTVTKSASISALRFRQRLASDKRLSLLSASRISIAANIAAAATLTACCSSRGTAFRPKLRVDEVFVNRKAQLWPPTLGRIAKNQDLSTAMSALEKQSPRMCRNAVRMSPPTQSPTQNRTGCIVIVIVIRGRCA
jgi:hypothetical protein